MNLFKIKEFKNGAILGIIGIFLFLIIFLTDSKSTDAIFRLTAPIGLLFVLSGYFMIMYSYIKVIIEFYKNKDYTNLIIVLVLGLITGIFPVKYIFG